MSEKRQTVENDEPTTTPDSPSQGTAAAEPAQKTYKKPTITRHGNLRLMTQLE
jgi:hypothetical protein